MPRALWSTLIFAAGLAVVLIAGGCTYDWYGARCTDGFGLRRGTAEFEACVVRERRIVEETQALADRSKGSP